MEFLKKYLILVSGFSLFIVESMSNYMVGRTSLTTLIIVATYIFFCLQNPEKKYISKALNCLKVGILAVLFSFVMRILINPLFNFEFTAESYVIYAAEYLPFAIVRLISSTVFASPIAFIVPLFFKTKVMDREDILDM